MIGSEERHAHFTVDAALSTIEHVSGFTEPARRRAEGVTIMLWGFVTAALLLSSEVLNLAYGFIHTDGWQRWVVLFMWVPWGAIGAVGTIAIWRIAEVGSRAPIDGHRRSWRWLCVWAATIVAIIVFPDNLIPLAAAGWAVVTLGMIWIGVGVFLNTATHAGRRTVVAVGAVIILVGIVFGMTLERLAMGAGFEYFTLVATVCGGILPIFAGIVLAMGR